MTLPAIAQLKYATVWLALASLCCYGRRANAVALGRNNQTTYILPTKIIQEFPPDTWIENIAVRQNGQILVTETTQPRIYQIDPFGIQQLVVVHEFNETASVTGIVEAEPDLFYVSTANLSSNFDVSYGQAYIYRIDMRTFTYEDPASTEVTRIASIVEAGALNGLAYLGNGTDTLVSADTLKGVIWSVDTSTGQASVAINNTYTQPQGQAVNGLKVRGKDLYFTNLVQKLLAKVPVDSKGRATGPTAILANSTFQPDDFALDLNGDAYVASPLTHQNAVVFVPREGGAAVPIATTAGPTSCAFGRTVQDCHILYVSTSRGDEAYMEGRADVVSGKVVKIEVGRQGMHGCSRDGQ
ncbi:hypothetical protein M409DRAFT_48951 [Zasmidium cellare ATCC 36951]|uniref:Uncharacterized protein n=1 Tax=Zasmidium cellare ATCC 36951 TaxID=1080233 RepID=A0A6A6D3V7_ZASCE|nr:uncharacterized protein M409DRAFT_48951 [Zasmidium cellare ATCC 36951]KAF2174067.1 hypothetical protein M409DRAFT_48951 [Zasmidium cellare ATCC 36951]